MLTGKASSAAFKGWVNLKKRSMRQHHVAGEKLFLNFCGPTVSVVIRQSIERLTGNAKVVVPMRSQAFHHLMMRLLITPRLSATIKHACRIDHLNGYAFLLSSTIQPKVSVNLWSDNRATSESDILIHCAGECFVFSLPVVYPYNNFWL